MLLSEVVMEMIYEYMLLNLWDFSAGERRRKNVFRENDKIERKIENVLDNSGSEDLFIPQIKKIKVSIWFLLKKISFTYSDWGIWQQQQQKK